MFVLHNQLDVCECSPRVPLYGMLCWDANKGLHWKQRKNGCRVCSLVWSACLQNFPVLPQCPWASHPQQAAIQERQDVADWKNLNIPQRWQLSVKNALLFLDSRVSRERNYDPVPAECCSQMKRWSRFPWDLTMVTTRDVGLFSEVFGTEIFQC